MRHGVNGNGVLTGEGGGGESVSFYSLVSVTRPGYNTLSRSFSDEMLSTPFSPIGVAVEGTGYGVDEIPSRLEREARVGLGSSLPPTGRTPPPGDVGLIRESS